MNCQKIYINESVPVVEHSQNKFNSLTVAVWATDAGTITGATDMIFDFKLQAEAEGSFSNRSESVPSFEQDSEEPVIKIHTRLHLIYISTYTTIYLSALLVYIHIYMYQ